MSSLHTFCHAAFWKKSEIGGVIHLEEYKTAVVWSYKNKILAKIGNFDALTYKRISGAPLVCPDKANNSILVGILSEANKMRESLLSTFENLAFSLDWIQKKIHKENKTSRVKNIMKFKPQRNANNGSDIKYFTAILMLALIFVT